MKKSLVLVALCLLISATSCSRFPGYKSTGTGLYYKTIVKGTGDKLQPGDIIHPRLAYYINDSLLFTTDQPLIWFVNRCSKAISMRVFA